MKPAGVIRTILLVDIAVMSLLSLCYLRQRRLSSLSFWGWGLLALLVPVLGPFLVIANRPGEWDPEFSVKKDLTRAGTLLLRLLPIHTEQETRLDRARRRYKNSVRGKSWPAGAADDLPRGLAVFFDIVRNARGAVNFAQRKKKDGAAGTAKARSGRSASARQK
jgi:hypothetical protein